MASNLTSLEPTNLDKLRKLLEKPYKLVKVQNDELLRIKAKRSITVADDHYIKSLYDHYEIEGKGKTYLQE